MAAELGITRQRVAKLREVAGFPAPVGEIAAGKIWDLDEVAAWSGSGLRRSAGRPAIADRRIVLNKRFQLETPPIGAGGFADVYRAADLQVPNGGRRSVVAVKVLRDLGDEEVRRRFHRELRIIRSLTHPNVVEVLDDGEDAEGHLWYAMPLALGSLHDEINTFAGRDDAILRVMRSICAGLTHVHDDVGIFHRDLKPANILKIANGEWAISDFGLAREAERKTTAMTSTARGLGTFIYAAPETWTNAREASAPADIFSLGKILQQLVTGQLPVVAEPPAGTFRSIVARATRPRAGDRYQSAEDFLTALENVVTGPPGRWETTEDIAERLAGRVRVDQPDESSLEELHQRLFSADDTAVAVAALRKVIPRLSKSSIRWFWSQYRGEFIDLMDVFSREVATTSWDYPFCDVIADFFDRAVLATKNDDVLRAATSALVRMGPGHNRWHVRAVLVDMLQRIRVDTDASAAMEGLRDGSAEDVEWCLDSAATRTLHPVLRDGVAGILNQLAEGSDVHYIRPDAVG